MKVLFMGTPDFAAAALSRIAESGYEVVGAVTQPDKPKGRGMTMLPSPVKVAAQELGVPVLQPERLREGQFTPCLEQLKPDIIVVAAYGKLLPEYILSYPRYGCINIHASLLPRWRGAAPIQRCIMAGDRISGVTTMQMDAGLDTGDMLEAAQTPITDTDNFESLHDRLAELGAELIVSTLRGIESGTLKPTPQPEEGITYAEKIGKDDIRIDLSLPARQLVDIIRGLSPVPLARVRCRGRLLKLVSAGLSPHTGANAEVGEVISLDGGAIHIRVGDGAIAVTELVPEGKKRMRASDFINGRGITVGDVLTGDGE